jgi:4-amino-4-deoxy-L-arabinose transferase-like glycosyltransferase
MTLHRGAQRSIIAIFFAVLVVVYVVAWRAPAIGLYYDDGVYLVAAKAIAAGHGYTIESLPVPTPQTKYPPLFPAILALFTLVSQQPYWLKLLPLGCAIGWLALTRRLLLKMGASKNGALLLVGLTAASPAVVFLSTNLLSESLFALLVTAALLSLLEERALLAGILAGLATLTRSAGVPLIAACILTLVVRRRFRSAVVLAAVATVMVAPWFGWSLAHVTRDAYHTGSNVVISNILTGLPANEKLVVFTRNLLSLFAGPFSLLTGMSNTISIIGTILVLVWCLFVRRQLVPDLFVTLYCVMLLCWIWPPERFLAPILPLVLWIGWRVFQNSKFREPLVAAVLVAALIAGWAAVSRLPAARANGYFQTLGVAQDNWNEMRKLFSFVRANTAPGSILLANLDPAFYLNTGRKSVRGFAPNGFDLFYAARQSAVTPDQLSNVILRSRVDYVVLTPDSGAPESPSFHKSVEALERGGVLDPISITGIAPDYRLLQVHGNRAAAQ